MLLKTLKRLLDQYLKTDQSPQTRKSNRYKYRARFRTELSISVKGSILSDQQYSIKKL